MDSQSNQENGFIFQFICWFIALSASLGSLFFSEVMEFQPCILCWYQRIAMYPLVIIFLVGMFQGPKEFYTFSLPFVIIGWIIALYHNLIHYEIVPESASPCLEGLSCATVYINWFGFLTIPMLSFMAFSLLGMGLFLIKRKFLNER